MICSDPSSIRNLIILISSYSQKLYDQGARRFWIHNTGPLGCLPENIDRFGKDPSKLDELGCVVSHNRAARFFNLQLHALCTKLQGDLAGANVTCTDIFSIKSNVIANFSRYGKQFLDLFMHIIGSQILYKKLEATIRQQTTGRAGHISYLELDGAHVGI